MHNVGVLDLLAVYAGWNIHLAAFSNVCLNWVTDAVLADCLHLSAQVVNHHILDGFLVGCVMVSIKRG